MNKCLVYEIQCAFSHVVVVKTKNEKLMEDRMYVRALLLKYTSANTASYFASGEVNPSMFIKSVIVWAPSEILKEWIEWIDFPGVNDKNAMRDNFLRVGLESVDQIIAISDKDLSSDEAVSEKIKEYGINRRIASMSPIALELVRDLRKALCQTDNNGSTASNENSRAFKQMKQLIDKLFQTRHFTSKVDELTSFIVRDTPFIATDPFLANKDSRPFGIENLYLLDSPSGQISSKIDTPSIWPVTICPPN